MPLHRKARVILDRADALALAGAAYVMTEEAFVILGRKGKKSIVELWPKKGAGVKDLVAAFEREYSNQLRRWALARQNQDVRLEVLRRALILADQAGAAPTRTAPELSREAKDEIARLIAESEAAPRDPLGITRTWAQGRAAGKK